MEFRMFKVKFNKIVGAKENQVRKISTNIEADISRYETEAKLHNQDISITSSKKVDSYGKEVKEAATTFKDSIKGCTAFKRMGNLIRFKYYTDEISDGLDYSYTDYYKRDSLAKTPPKFHETFFVYISSISEGIVFAPCSRAEKVNSMFRNELKTLLNLDSDEEIKFTHSVFKKVYDKIVTKSPKNILKHIKHIGAVVKDKSFGTGYMSLNVYEEDAYIEYTDISKKYDEFELKKISFTTELSMTVDGETKNKLVDITLSSNLKYPIKLGLSGSTLWYEDIFSWIGEILLD